jgi:hypothetical protein
MGTKDSRSEQFEKDLADSYDRDEWLAEKIINYLESGSGIAADDLYIDEDDELHNEKRRKIAEAIQVDFEEVDYAISKMFF